MDGVMAAKGSVASIRKKLLSRLSSSGDDRRKTPVKTTTTHQTAADTTDAPAAPLAGGRRHSSTSGKKKASSPRRRRTEIDQQQFIADGLDSCLMTYQDNSAWAVDECVVDDTSACPPQPSRDTADGYQHRGSAPVDLVASCSTHAHNHRSATSASAVVRDVITSQPPQQHSQGMHV